MSVRLSTKRLAVRGLLCLFAGLALTVLNAQQIMVTGKVTDDKGEALPGVNIVLRGSAAGQVTDVNGRYSIGVPGTDGVLIFSFVGYISQEISVGNRTVVDVELVQDTKALEEVVVVGYGTMRKSDLTGAITKVNIDQQSELANVNVLQSLQGSVPGLNIGAVTSSGSTPSMTIRGQNTLSGAAADNAPLIVVDGIIYRGSLMDINPSNIQSMEILKDASSASIYGSQAANGVVIITTKKGIDLGKPVISYSGQYSLQVPSHTVKPYMGKEYEDFLMDVFWDLSRLAPDYTAPNPNFSLTPYLKTLEVSEGYTSGRNINWWDMLTGNGYIQSHNLGIRGKSGNTGYFVSAGFSDQSGFIKNDLYKRYDLRANLDTRITDWMDFGMESFFAQSDYSGVSPALTSAFHMQPYAPLYDKNGEYAVQPDGSLLNPFLQYQIDDSDKRMNLFANLHMDIRLPFLDGFNYRVNYSHNYRTVNQDQFNPWGANFTGSGYKNSDISYDWTFDHIFSYKKGFGADHRLDVTLLYGVEKRSYKYTNASAQNFTNPVLGYNRLQAGSASLNSIETGAQQESSLYTMGRLFYSFRNRYLFTGTVRRDGFSGFGTARKMGVFPSFALGWVISEEGFFQNPYLDYLKLRGSYGTTARRAVGRYQTLARMSSQPMIIFGDGGTTTIGQWISSMSNNDLGWETTTGLNLGLDFELLKSRVQGNVEFYTNNTKDILYNIQIPQMTGFTSIATNIGKVRNHGFEFALSGTAVKHDKFSWEPSVNFSLYRNKIVSILGADNNGDDREDDIVTSGLFIGKPQSVIFDYEIAGMWQLEDREAGRIPSGFFPGTYRLTDTNNDGVIDPSDRKILGYSDPAYRFGIANTFRHGNFSLYVFINSIQGGKSYYYADGSPYVSSNFIRRDQLSYMNALKWDYWLPTNPDAKYRRLDTPATYDARPYDQRNFVRLQDISLAYTFHTDFLKIIGLRSLKLNVSAKNLLTLTKWEGVDPETGTGLVPGLPVMKSYTVGLNVEL